MGKALSNDQLEKSFSCLDADFEHGVGKPLFVYFYLLTMQASE
jgi:hypothetical protein